jgi:phosphatidylserine decarboxylase
MDPFCVISFGKKVFRTRVIRHSLNPVWNEKLLFHVHRFETSFRVSLRILDWDKLSGNDYIGGVSFELPELMANVPKPDPNTGLYSEEVTQGEHEMTDYKIPITTEKPTDWEYKHSPILLFRCGPTSVCQTLCTDACFMMHQCQVPAIQSAKTTILATISETI